MKITKGSRIPYSYDYSGNYVIGDFYHNGGELPIGTYNLDDRIMKAIVEIFHFFTDQNKVIVLSAYRSTQHNKDVGGADNSLHPLGKAIDFYFQKNNNFSKSGALGIFKDNFSKKGSIYQTLLGLGVGEIEFHNTSVHIGIINHNGTILVINEFKNTVQETIVKKEQVAVAKIVTPSKTSYEYYHQDSSLSQISLLLNDVNSTVATKSMTAKEFMEYSVNGKSNLSRVWELYTETQKMKFSKEYKADTIQMRFYVNQPDADSKKQYIYYNNLRKNISLKYENVDYDLPVGSLLVIPSNKTNLEVLAVIGRDLFMKQQDLKTFLDDEFKTLITDPTYIRSQKVNISNGSYDINYLHVAFSVWIYLRKENSLLNISPFVRSVGTTVADGGGTFSIELMEIDNLDNIREYSETYYSYIQKTQDKRYNLSYFEKSIQQNDIIFIRFEKLDIEGKTDNRSITDLHLSEDILPNKVYDMMGLVDISSESYSPGPNVATFNFSGRDFTKMLIEDGSYFFPFALTNNSKEFFLNYNINDTAFQRLFASGDYINIFTALFRSIRDSVGFIFNQISHTGALDKNSTLFDAYKDRQTKNYNTVDKNSKLQVTNEVNGVWKIIKLVVDHQLDERRLNNGELSCPEGSMIDLVKRICFEPFVEFWGDTLGDKFVFMARQPPFTKDQIVDYIENKNMISITSDQAGDVDLNWDETYYTWYKLEPLDGLFGSDTFVAGTAFPIVYFEEYANLFGMHKKVVSDPYIATNILTGSKEKENVDMFRQSLANDFKFLVESNAILPFTRKGNISIVGGDRRIKKGMWVLFEPTNEICYVKSVTNSVQVSDNLLNRTTSLQVERCMLKQYVAGGSGKFNATNGKENNYFDIINMDVLLESLNAHLIGDNQKPASNVKLVNTELFDFFSKKQQWD